MTKEELGQLEMTFIRTLAGIIDPDQRHVAAQDGKLVDLSEEQSRAKTQHYREKAQLILREHFSLMLAVHGVRAEQFQKGIVYCPGPCMLVFEGPNGAEVRLDFFEQFVRPQFQELLEKGTTKTWMREYGGETKEK